MFAPFLTTFVQSLHAAQTGDIRILANQTSWDFQTVFSTFNKVFDKLLRGFEDKAAQV